MKHMFSRIFITIAGFTLLVLACFSLTSFSGEAKRMKLVWADEFSKDGLPDSTRWGYDVGNGCPVNCGWGNNELQYYTSNREQNARVKDGHLIIEAHREKMGDMGYSSARLVSKKKGDWTYGRIDVRAKLPVGTGVWPAIWMLPTDWVYGGWPGSGEIDIMEHVGYIPDSIFGTVHTNLFNGMLGTQKSKGVASATISSEFHNYGIEWTADKIDFLFDDKVYSTFRNRHEGSDAWPFDLDFHLLLNIAVGGNWGGKMGVDTAIWPQQMIIDYVRVYQ
jgi:beta-glucanase (GH16 family)